MTSSICRSNVNFPYRNTASSIFDIDSKTYQRHNEAETVEGLKDINSKYKRLLNKDIYSKKLPFSMIYIQDANTIASASVAPTH